LIKEKLENFKNTCNIGIYAFDNNDIIFRYNENRVQDGACVLKVFIMLDYIRQVEEKVITGKELLEVTSNNFATGAGTVKFLSEGMKIAADDLIDLMISISDHMAANILIDFLGMEHINETIKMFDFKHTKLLKKYLVPNEYYIGETTAYEYALFYKKLDNNEFFSSGWCNYMKRILESQRYKDFLIEPLIQKDNFVKMQSKTGKMDGRTISIPVNSCVNDGGICVTKSKKYYIAFLSEIFPESKVQMEDMRKLMHEVSNYIFERVIRNENHTS
jgi:beta-lactamase class A